MKLQFRQKSMGWCTVYTLANIFRNSEFLRFTEEERYKGCRKDEVDYMLNELGYGLRVSHIMYANQFYSALPKGYVYSTIKSFKDEITDDIQVKTPVVPYLLSVRLIPTIYHSVAVLMIGDNMYYIDPYKDEMIHIESFEQFDTLFIDCREVERFYRTNDEKFVFLMGEKLGYDALMEKGNCIGIK